MEEEPPQSSSMSTEQKMQLKYDLTSDKLPDFIESLRDKARDKDQFSHRRPILPLESDADPPFIDIFLQEGGIDKGLAKIRRYDLRLICYEDPFGNLFNVDEFQLYDDSKLVKFGIEGLLLGLPAFINAVSYLSKICKEKDVDLRNSLLVKCDGKNSTNIQEIFNVRTSFLVKCDSKNLTHSQENLNVRTSLAVLCLVLCEAAKFDLFSCMLGNAFNSGFEVPLSSWLLDRINDWGYYSEIMLEVDQHDDTDDCNCYIPDDSNAWHDDRRVIGVTCQDVAKCMGILRAVPPPPDPMVEEYLSGARLVQIFSVSVFINGGRSASVYGTIKIDCGCHVGTFIIYDRDHTRSESIQSHGTLSLQDPDGSIIARNMFEFQLDILEDGGDNLEIINGEMEWDSGYLCDDATDTRISAMFRGKNGYAIVYYTVYAKAIRAEVEVTLLRKEGHPDTSCVCVCGRLSGRVGYLAYAADFHEKYYQTIFFDKPVSKESSMVSCALETCECGEQVKLGESIKLSRSVVNIPVDDSLVIVAHLQSCGGKPIATGSIEWLPREVGEFENIMVGQPNDSHLLRVKVKWVKID